MRLIGILLVGLLSGCRSQPETHTDYSALMPNVLAIAEQTVNANYPTTDIAGFTRTAEVEKHDVVIRYERRFVMVATPEEPFTRTILDTILVRMSGTDVISASRSQMELNRIPPSRNNI